MEIILIEQLIQIYNIRCQFQHYLIWHPAQKSLQQHKQSHNFIIEANFLLLIKLVQINCSEQIFPKMAKKI